MRANAKFSARAGFCAGLGAFAILAGATGAVAADLSIGDVQWVARPVGDDLARVYPTRAHRFELSGRAVLRCSVEHDGTMSGCGVLFEEPVDMGFGEAALALTPRFRLAARTRTGQPTAGGTVRVPIRFVMPGDYPPERPVVLRPSGAAAAAYWPEGLAGDLGAAAVLMNCFVGDDGSLRTCVTVKEIPGAFGFKEAAQRMVAEGQLAAGEPPANVPAPADGIWRIRVEFRKPLADRQGTGR